MTRGLAAFFRDAYQSQWRPNMTEVWQRRREHRLFVVVAVAVTAATVASVFCFSRYELPVRDNIAFGSLAHADDTDGLRAVARQAGLLKFIEGLPDGWDTVLSSGYPGGVDASGGQWQTVANARAADLIVVLDGGRVVEAGTHDTLSRAGGLYAELFRLQARYFV